MNDINKSKGEKSMSTAMVEVQQYLTDVNAFIKGLDADKIIINLQSAWALEPEVLGGFDAIVNQAKHFNENEVVSLSGAIELGRELFLECEKVVVINATNHTFCTHLEYISFSGIDNARVDAKTILANSKLNVFTGDNYHDEDITY